MIGNQICDNNNVFVVYPAKAEKAVLPALQSDFTNLKKLYAYQKCLRFRKCSYVMFCKSRNSQ